MACRPLCVYCRQRPMEAASAPFCSPHCKDADLGRWLRGDYRIPAEPAPEPGAADGAPDGYDPLFEDR